MGVMWSEDGLNDSRNLKVRCVFLCMCVCMNVRACVFLHVLIKRRRWKVPESCAFHDAWLRGLSASHR